MEKAVSHQDTSGIAGKRQCLSHRSEQNLYGSCSLAEIATEGVLASTMALQTLTTHTPNADPLDPKPPVVDSELFGVPVDTLGVLPVQQINDQAVLVQATMVDYADRNAAAVIPALQRVLAAFQNQTTNLADTTNEPLVKGFWDANTDAVRKITTVGEVDRDPSVPISITDVELVQRQAMAQALELLKGAPLTRLLAAACTSHKEQIAAHLGNIVELLRQTEVNINVLSGADVNILQNLSAVEAGLRALVEYKEKMMREQALIKETRDKQVAQLEAARAKYRQMRDAVDARRTKRKRDLVALGNQVMQLAQVMLQTKLDIYRDDEDEDCIFKSLEAAEKAFADVNALGDKKSETVLRCLDQAATAYRAGVASFEEAMSAGVDATAVVTLVRNERLAEELQYRTELVARQLQLLIAKYAFQFSHTENSKKALQSSVDEITNLDRQLTTANIQAGADPSNEKLWAKVENFQSQILELTASRAGNTANHKLQVDAENAILLELEAVKTYLLKIAPEAAEPHDVIAGECCAGCLYISSIKAHIAPPAALIDEARMLALKREKLAEEQAELARIERAKQMEDAIAEIEARKVRLAIAGAPASTPVSAPASATEKDLHPEQDQGFVSSKTESESTKTADSQLESLSARAG